jgi:hypothetical protein
MSIADPATHTDHEIGAEAVIARQRAEIERLRQAIARAGHCLELGYSAKSVAETLREALTAAQRQTLGNG